jgi:hypothetical protein
MSWRNFESHKEETKAVKQALADVAIRAKVGHGTGTAWAWLDIHVLNRLSIHHDREKYGWDHCSGNCEACIEYRTLYSRVVDVARTVTGRSGAYDGEIQVRMD